ncbi:hypothetical protein [Ethanoligenens harbinense]|uniref:hypothetical protein n=1 Tax=Ethanoligenens harbinense TaxID=253239 RepID=UPI0010C05C92|nr:hypothetical protein [Ethanoligenens harbinense]
MPESGRAKDTMERWLASETGSHDAEKICLRQSEDKVQQLRKDTADLKDTVEILKKRRPSSSKTREEIRNDPRT